MYFESLLKVPTLCLSWLISPVLSLSPYKWSFQDSLLLMITPSSFSLSVSSILCPSTSMDSLPFSLAALSSGCPTTSNLLLSPATHNLLSFNQLTMLLTSFEVFPLIGEDDQHVHCLCHHLHRPHFLLPHGMQACHLNWLCETNQLVLILVGLHCLHTLNTHLFWIPPVHIGFFLQGRTYTSLQMLHQSCIVWVSWQGLMT